MNLHEGHGVDFAVDSGLAVVRLEREHGNAIDPGLVEGLLAAARRADGDPTVRGVLLAARGKLFCPGLDLVDLRDLDRPAMRAFMNRFAECVAAWYTLGKPVVAALQGHALAGGCIVALLADLRILKAGAMIGLNEVRVGVPLPYGVAWLLRDSVHRDRIEEVALLGRNYSGEEAVGVGLVHEIATEAGFDGYCMERLEELASKPAGAFGATKRYLRWAVAERLRGEPPERLEEFLDCWFEAGTRRRIDEIVAGLQKKK
ncbi:MAG: enoyl-CoA hydratase/isomerase family protein [Acidobacteriia bacterium]|nr:enoyl-CoA hydratase/isomerase family protein [Terriglobia bacterium]